MLPKLNAKRGRTVDEIETFINDIDYICDKFDSHGIKDDLLDFANHSLEALEGK